MFLRLSKILRCFPYIAYPDSRVLILGSMPSVKSLEENQYYAHPQNRFWRVMFLLAKEEYSADYEIKKQVLKKLKVALWDSIGVCEREGSLDADIKNEYPNDICGFLEKFPSVRRIAANGRKSAATLKKFFPQLSFTALPSTSAANAAVSLSRLAEIYGNFVFGR